MITAIVPCYNAQHTIEACVSSLIKQKQPIDEIIIIDDGSDQETKTILREIKSKYRQVEIFSQANQGVSVARNLGISRAKYDLLLLLDADDTFEPSFTEKAVKKIYISDNIGAVICDYNVVQNGIVINRSLTYNASLESFLINNSALGNGLYKKKVLEKIGGYDPKMLLGYEDWEMNIRFIAAGYRFHVIQEYLFNYTVNPVSRNSIAKDNDLDLRMYIYKKHKELYIVHLDDIYKSLLEEKSLLKHQRIIEQDRIEVRWGKRVRNLARRYFK